MVARTDTTRVQRWLRGRLNTVGLPVYRTFAPEAATYPCVIFRRLSGVDAGPTISPNGSMLVRSVWLVFAASAAAEVNPETQQPVSALEVHADAIHDALVGNWTTLQNGRYIEACRRESEYDEPVVEGGIEYQQIGGVFRVWSSLA